MTYNNFYSLCCLILYCSLYSSLLFFFTGGAADICQLCVGDEILAINDVRLDSSLTQDGIVQLIVDSVITGNLALDIRRYGKAKKSKELIY